MTRADGAPDLTTPRWDALDDQQLAALRAQYLSDPVNAIIGVDPQVGRSLPRRRVTPRADLAGRADCPPEVMDLLAMDKPTVRLALVGNEACIASALETAVRVTMKADKPYFWMTWWTVTRAISHPNCPQSLSRRLAREGEPLRALATANCPADLVSELSRHPELSVRLRAIDHPGLPDTDLVEHCSDGSTLIARSALRVAVTRVPEEVSHHVAALPAGPRRTLMRRVAADVLERFANAPDPRLRYTVAQVTAHMPTLERLAGDRDGRVRRAASTRLLRALTSA